MAPIRLASIQNRFYFSKYRRFTSPPNPWNKDYYSGGSSTGNAVLLALGVCPFAIGSDFTGNIRIPAGYCGIIGLKPTFSRISNKKCWKKGFIEAFLTVGVMATCASDAEIVLNFMNDIGGRADTSKNNNEILITNLDIFPISKIRFGFYTEYINVHEL